MSFKKTFTTWNPLTITLSIIAAVLLICHVAPKAEAAALTDFAENKIYDATLRGQSLDAPSTFYVALYTSLPGDAGVGTEVTGGAYARVPVASTLNNWSGTQSPGSTVVSNGVDGKGENNIVITFPAPTAAWGVVTGMCLVDAPTGGDAWICSALSNNKTINNGDAAPSITAGAWNFRIDN